MKKMAFLIVAALFCAGLFVNAPVSSQGHKEKVRKNANKIENNYIVVLDDSVVGERGEYSIAGYMADDMARNYRGKVKHVYKHALNGFSVEMSEADAEAMSQDYRVLFVEEDGVMTADATQTNPPWGLDRIDQRNRPLSATYTYNWTGSGVRAYIIDTGIRTTHTQFGGRASNVFDAFGGNGADCNGHGTHVAGTVGGSTYGVAKSALLRGVRVLDCNGSGSTSGVIAGVDWVRVNHIAPAVANMSLGGGVSTALDTAVNNFSNAACDCGGCGNSNANACNSSGSLRTPYLRFDDDHRCAFVFLEPERVLTFCARVTCRRTSPNRHSHAQRYSMASPRRGGGSYKQANPSASATTIRNAIVNNATTNNDECRTGSPNRLLYSLFLLKPHRDGGQCSALLTVFTPFNVASPTRHGGLRSDSRLGWQ